MALSTSQSRLLTRVVAYGRMAVGAGALIAPQLLVKSWVGEDNITPATKVLARAFGARDLALGLGAALSLNNGAATRGWVEAGGLADTGDLIATLAGFKKLPTPGRWLVVAAAGGALAASRLTAPTVDG